MKTNGNVQATATPLRPTEDLNVIQTVSLVSPRHVKADLPMTATVNQTVVEGRDTIKRILHGQDPRLLVVVGPCSIHDEKAAIEFARKLRDLAAQVSDRLVLVMRVYFEKPRTTLGWKGLINDPHLDGSFDMEAGIRLARRILLDIGELGLPTGTEMLDPITPQYIADLVSWATIGARTIESQTHRQMASGLSMPVGYKNATGGDLQTAIDAMKSAWNAHSFLGIDDDGRTAMIHTRGNQWGHLILRGGREGANYDASSVARASELLSKAKLAGADAPGPAPGSIMVDCSHANSLKRFKNQVVVWRDVVAQRVAGNHAIIGVLVESNLFEGSQPFPQPIDQLRYGVSITDECLGWDTTEEMIRWTYERMAPVH
ncbi:MAG: 3-deoxy-7-phosphoheptulonate synthase [Phycisphaeraceae bacterium]